MFVLDEDLQPRIFAAVELIQTARRWNPFCCWAYCEETSWTFSLPPTLRPSWIWATA